MASLISGFEYDIFISYRQKDNKYDGWVTEFVENLNRELESMFKDAVSAYFDINPSDYLLESYDVDASLKDKLRCLVFMPVISRTYCDPKAFAWEHEFKAFIDMATSDRFGLKVKLPNGNFANRILPVRIHDLDSADISLFESTIGSVLRPIDFVYKEIGVNRQLRAKDDDIKKSPGHVLYRDQINKVALAIREIIQGMKSDLSGEIENKRKVEAKEVRGKQKKVPEEALTFEKKKQERDIIIDQVSLQKMDKSGPAFLKAKFIIPLFVITFLIVGAVFLFKYVSEVKWAKGEGLKEIESLYGVGNYNEAFILAKRAEQYIPKDSALRRLLSEVSTGLTILSDPPGADIYWEEYSDTTSGWAKIGQTPVDSLQLPVYSFHRYRIEMAGYETVYGAAWAHMDTLTRKLLKQGEIPPGMVYVDGYWDELKNTWEKDLGFFLDKYEVTNRQYKEFVDHSGYRNRDYWKHEFIKEGRKISWEQAMAEFVDKTGRPGPSTWAAGDYLEGQDDYPVSGVSWYEAVAYAEYAGKVLPSADHWDSGVGYQFFTDWSPLGSAIIPLSNFSDNGPVTAGRQNGISMFGAYDMAGNVREWCLNESPLGRIVAGAGYEGPTYLFLQWDQLSPLDRSPLNGFRCALYKDREKIPETAFRFVGFNVSERNILLEKPVPESTFRIYRNQFLYDKKALNAVLEMRDGSSEDWIMEKVTFDAAYENQRMIAYLYLPRNASPPFQTLIFFPGSYAITSKDFLTDGNGVVNNYFDYILKSGRAAVYPVFFSTYERNNGTTSDNVTRSHEYTELLVKLVKDFSRTIDYLETRADIDTGKLGFYGHSWGGRLGAIIPAVEDRLSLNILVAGGFPSEKAFPEADEINYVTRVKMPTLMLNGKYDAIFPLEENVKIFFNLLGTPEADKKLSVIAAGHNFYKKDRIKEILNWCDKYFGPPVNMKEN